MLVIISDLHLTDGTSGETIRAGAFQTFKERLRELACDASWRSDDKYVPIKGIDLVLLGDILDVIRSTRWWDGSPGIRPWSDPSDPEFAKTIACITDDILEKNRDSLGILRSLHDLEIMGTPPPQAACSPVIDSPNAGGGTMVRVPVRIHYLVGNHDWFYHLKGPAYDAIRKRIVGAIGLDNDPNIIFPHDPDESSPIGQIYREHGVFARHGDIFDSSNFEHDRDGSSLGENQIGQNEAGHDFAEYPGVSGGDLLRLLAYHTGVERPVKRYTNQPYRSCGCEKPTYVHNSAPSSSAEEAFPLLLAN